MSVELEGTRLATLAASRGLPAAVAETPTAPPARLRPERLLRKQQAGASVAVLNHVRSPAEVADFLTGARTLGVIGMLVLIVILQFVTAPVSAHLTVRVAYRNTGDGQDQHPDGTDAGTAADDGPGQMAQSLMDENRESD